jgi:hypothetical protein
VFLLLELKKYSVIVPTKGLYYKTLWIHNWQKNDEFRSKLVYSDLDKHTSLDKQKY